MNERIKEIREQAWTLVSNEERERGESYEVREQWERCDQKFAELIVKECAGIYSKIDNGNLHMGTDDYLEALHRTFFGVKE